jgi:hypothetical protein
VLASQEHGQVEARCRQVRASQKHLQPFERRRVLTGVATARNGSRTPWQAASLVAGTRTWGIAEDKAAELRGQLDSGEAGIVPAIPEIDQPNIE